MSADDRLPIVDAMLDEWLANRKPHPISTEELRSRPVDPTRILELNLALQSAAADVRSRSIISPASLYRKRKSYSATMRVLVSLAACLIIGLGIWALADPTVFNLGGSNKPAVVTAEKAQDKKLNRAIDSTSVIATQLKQDPRPSEPTNKSVVSKSERESLPMDSLPFAADGTASLDSKRSGNRKQQVAKLDDKEVISVIDNQMRQIWQRHNANPAAPIDGPAWVERVAQRVLSRKATQEEKDAFAKRDSLALRLDWMHRVVNSSEFAQTWSKRIAAQYLDLESNLIQFRDLSPERRAFAQWVRKEINQTHRLGSVVKRIVLAEGVGSNNIAASPSSHWWAEVGALDVNAPAEVMASVFLGERSSCSRCHESGKVAAAEPARFWGIAAITHGVEVSLTLTALQPETGFRKDAEPLFYERGDATVVAALPSLPDGRPLKAREGNAAQVRSITKQNLTAFYNWMIESDEFAKSQANFVWQSLFGRPLIMDIPLDDDLAGGERNELAKILGQQFRANEFDLRSIVTWIATSQAFGLESIRHDGGWYQVASDKDISSLQRRQALFAAFTSSPEPQFRSLDRLANWIESSNPNRDRGGVLANPLPPSLLDSQSKPITEKSNPAAKTLNFTESQVQYLLDVSSLPMTLNDEINRLVQSSLPWDALVDHAFYMTGSKQPNFSDRYAAQQILDMSRDKRLALQRIVAARLP